MAKNGVIRDFLVSLGFDTDNSGLANMKSAMDGIEWKAKALNGALMALATGAVVAVRQTASELDKLYFSSQRIGASVTNINAYGNAIAQLGGSADGAIGSLESLAEKIRNSPGYEGQLKSLGVSTRDANGAMRDRVEVMKDLSGVLTKMPAYQANAYANSLGIDQKTMLAMRDGKFISNMEKYQKIQKELGMNDDLAKSGNEFMTEYRDLTMMTKTGFQVIVMQAGKALIPILRLLNQLIQAGIHAFSQLNPQIKEGLAIGLRFAMLALMFSAMAKSLGLVLKFIPALKTFIGLLKLFRLAFLASPIGIILALGAALALLYDDYKTWRDGGKSLFDWSKWTNGIDTIINKIKDFLDILNKVKDKTVEFVQKIIKDPAGALKEVATEVQQGVQNAKNAVQNYVNPSDPSKATPLQNKVSSASHAVKGAIEQSVAVAAGVAKATVGAVTSTVKTGKALKLSEQDIVDIMKVASTEVVGSLKGKNFEMQAAGVIDTILNRTASGKYGKTLRDVVNQKNAFSDINSKQKTAYGSVQKVPMSRVSKRLEKFVREYLEARANGKESSVGLNVSYANPYYLGKASANTKKWVAEVVEQAKVSGQTYGAGKAIHVHGTPSADRHKMPKPYFVSTPGTGKTPNGSASLAAFAQSAELPNIISFAPPSGNPHKSQINNSNGMTANNVVINQSYQTDMTINGASSPVDSANAVRRQQENAMTFMARGAKGVLVG
ncbi:MULTISPECIES: cell wall hydrolase [Acinetobacter]|uniref:Phage tail tape measure protein, TP901 family, core region n=1 Tax=Acinetobacter genomosp. 33YU TaxID=1675530 RepID=A0A1V2UNL1_9GAMM|nr:cell wall hydrolase [Acinetobacter genomosp. 33YU]ONN48989.1 phage tail tape measure protein, TP901 family, core region [Acinetobacter genomosp. 33YU]